ncbi:NAD(P)/FAD-dependent oxidoreductase [Cryobacterium sp. 10S3]|uniref:phytoene desaturase family protein n=1 Tax=unclassified Cryobacterium TaxID=2649013 RepID=UPI002AC9BA95|nr:MULTISPECIES: NAD(P)/FAD-dependent oxidoreductase [unclassified Cryobacterium]MEB0201397.1 NAD(P)/FAD-dependent oxidoreductase [Cryobacterium sp. 5I3]MEB0286408.1 NAD(P)/FAD-dependent oxidoreductase [Cryobacterium sp. 10S3]WPX14946.1 NAD(P)/FAD-dependent oxidoreductase [Cryobacterium sp. 10S3]
MPDVNVVGAGPNGLAAAVVCARAGLSVTVSERAGTAGGGLRTSELTLPGFRHDLGSAVHPAALASPFFRAFGLSERVPFVIPEVSYAHPLDAHRAAIAYRDLDRTAAELGRDGPAWTRLLRPLVDRIDGLVSFTGHQLLRWPDDPRAALDYGLRVLALGTPAGRMLFHGPAAPALLSGVAAHAPGRQPALAQAGAGLLLAAEAHADGWGYPVGGAQAIADALVADLLAHGGTLRLNTEVRGPDDLDPARVTLLDTSTVFLDRFAGPALPDGYRRALRRYRYGTGVAKVDFALSGPVPWTNPRLALAPTVHLGGSRVEVERAERLVSGGRSPRHPFVLLAQPSVLDARRAPAGKAVLWAYTHVPAGWNGDPALAIVRAIERYAPGFRDTILAAASHTPAELAAGNPNLIGGDILGGAVSLRQLVKRPVVSTHPWRTPVPGLYLCSASTPPGPAVHGMNGCFAAALALREHFGIHTLPDLAP